MAEATRGRLSERERHDLEDQVREQGFCVIRGHFPRDKLERWHKAFLELLEHRIAEGTASERGPHRYYVSLPFIAPWADPEIYEDPDILAIVGRLGGGDIVMPELASDTPLKGSAYQKAHRDAPLRSKDLPDLDPREPFQFAVNFPTVDITRENGPFEIAPRTHLLGDREAKELAKSPEIESQLEPLYMTVGDVMIRDVRGIHRGSPNLTDKPRPMFVVGYNRRRHLRPQLRIFIPRSEFVRLSPRAKKLLDLNPIVETIAEASKVETYSDLEFLKDY